MMEKNRKKRIIAAVAIILIVAVCLILGFGKTALFERKSFTGEAETEIVPAVSEVSGKITEMSVELGQHVEEGDVLALIDSTNQQYAVDQLEIQLEQAILAESNSANNTGDDLLSAQANYNSAAAASGSALENYEDAKGMFQIGAISESELTAAKLAYTQAESARISAMAALDKANENFATENQKANVALMQSQLEQSRKNLEKYKITAQCSGTIITKSYEKGSVVAAGYTIVEIAQDENIAVVVYVPERRLLAEIEYGSQFIIKYDGVKYEAKVIWIDVSTSYVPRDLQTSANKSKKSFKVKLLPEETCPIRPGETAKVYFN